MKNVQANWIPVGSTATLSDNYLWEGKDGELIGMLNAVTREGLDLFADSLLGPDGDPHVKVAYFCQDMLGKDQIEVVEPDETTEGKRVY